MNFPFISQRLLWALVLSLGFVMPVNAQINIFEYFIDEDPGLGNATPVSTGFTPGNTVNLALSIPLGHTLSPGFHSLHMRAKAGNRWGHYSSQWFFTSSVYAANPQLTAAEYFFDTDPGLGNGTTLNLGTGDSLNTNVSIPVPNTLGGGMHTLNIRARSNTGAWGHYVTQIFFVSGTSTAQGHVTAIEYFFDEDPGTGNGMVLSFTAADTVSQVFAIPVTGLSQGFHTLYVRAQNDNNVWGHLDSRIIIVSGAPGGSRKIVAAEYFIDTDPGLGNGTPIAVNPAVDSYANNHVIVLPADLSDGTHTLVMRVKNEQGVWSLFDTKDFAAKHPKPGSGHALSFNGSNAQVNIPVALVGTAYTAEAWVKLNGANMNKSVLSFSSGNPATSNSHQIRLNAAGRFEHYIYDGSGKTLTGTTIPDAGKWYHVVVTATNNGQMKLYVNGVEEGTAINVGTLWNSMSTLHIAQSTAGSMGYLNGVVDEVRIWNTALSEVQIRDRMCRKINAGDALFSNLVLKMDFDEGQGNAVFDNDNNISGSISGGTWVISGAPIGDASAHNYSGAAASAALSHPIRNDVVTAALTGGTANGLQVYCVTDTANTIAGTTCMDVNEGYFGVFPVGGTNVIYDVQYNYTPFVGGGLNEQGFKLYSRSDNSALSWINAAATVDTVQNLLEKSDAGRGEYIVSSAVVAPTIVIHSSRGSSICLGDTVTFSTVLTNEGTAPVYEWRKNGAVVGTSVTYSDNTLAEGDIISCKVLSNSECVSPDSAISNSITMTVGNLPAAVSIAASPGNQVCAGTQVNFTATPVHGGANPVYQWKVNGSNIGGNAAVLALSNLVHNDIVTVEMQTSEACAFPATAVSSGITMQVTPLVQPAISISSDEGTTICLGTPVTFTATISNGGGNPVYQWKKNGSDVGTSSDTYTTNTLNHNDVITCQLSSDAACSSPATVTATPVTMNVSSSAPATITVSANGSTTICAGASLSFTASVTNGGSNPVYQWKKNGSDAGTNSNTYTDNALADGDQITCELLSSSSCATPNTASGNIVSIVVYPFETPTISIAATQADTICSGTLVQFSASVTNAGNAPSYQWRKNGIAIADANGATYSSSTLSSGDTISCVLNSNYPCLSDNAILSNSIYKVVEAVPVADAGADRTILQGSSTVLAASGGISYLWSTGDTSASIIVTPNSTTTYTLSAYNEAGCSSTDAVTVTVNYSSLSISPSTYNFGNVVIGDTVFTNITVTNTGTLTETINAVSISGVFAADFTAATLAPSQSVQILLRFVPSGTLIYQQSLQIQTTVGDYTLVIRGRGVNPAPAWTISPVSYNYGNVPAGDSAMQAFTIQNTGNVPVSIADISSDNPAFEVFSAPAVIAVNASAAVFVKFKPTVIATYNGQLTIDANNAGLADLSLSLTGMGYQPGTQPVLSFRTDFPYNGTSGVDRPVAVPGVFTYSVVYKHPDGVPPAAGFPKLGIDANNDQDFVDVNEVMVSMSKLGNGSDWVNGETYVFSTSLNLGSAYGYRFFAKDALGNDAAAINTSYVSGPLVTNQSLDLSIYANDITFSDNNPAVGQTFTVFAEVHNNSPYSASNVPVRYYMDSVFFATDTIPFIAANTSITVNRNLSFNTDGFYPIKVWIDSAGTLTENNVLNNYAIRPVIVGHFTLPGAILTTTNAVTSSCNTTAVAISGTAVYDGLNLSGNPPVLGATVTVTIAGGPTFTTHTVTGGNWSVYWSDFSCGQNFDYTVTITDYTLTSAPANGSFNAPCVSCNNNTPQAYLSHSGSISYCVSENTPTPYTVSISTSCVNPAYFRDTTFMYINNVLAATQFADTIHPCTPVVFSNNFSFGIGSHVLSYRSVFYDSAGNRNEVSGSNNILVGEYPDLYIGTFSRSGPTAFSFRDWNGSYCVGAGAHTVYLYDSTAGSGAYVLLDSFNVSHIPPTYYTTPWESFTYSNPAMEMGYHYLKIVTDIHDAVTEFNEANNVFHTVFYVPFPELRISDIVLSNSDIVEGSQVNFSAVVHNTGAGAGAFKVQFYANNVPFGTPAQVDTMIANSSVGIISDIYTVPADTCPIVITAMVDVLNEVPELNESNNKDSMYIAYDIASGVGCFGLGSACNPYIVVRDSLVQFYSLITNSGTRDIHQLVDVTFKVGGQTIGQDNVAGGIVAGSSKGTSVLHRFETTGSYVITVHPDTANVHCELYENNNVGAIYVVVVEGMPDLEILSQHISPSNLNPNPGQSISVVASVFNKGNQASVPATVRFWVDDVPLGIDVPINAIAAGADTTVAATVSYVPNSVGPKIIKVMVDAEDLVVELREDNNTATRAIIAGAAPDIASSLHEAVTLSTPWARKDDTITISNYLRNYGGEAGSGWLKFFVTDNNDVTALIDSVFFSLASNDSTLVSLDWKVNFVGQGKISTEIVHVMPQEYNIHNNSNETVFEAGPRLKILSYTAVDSTLCTGDMLDLAANIATDGQAVSYEWKHDGDMLPGFVGTVLNIAAVVSTDSGSYRLSVSDAFATKTTDPITIVINKPIQILQQPYASWDICEGNIIDLSVQAENVAAYQWEHNSVAIPGADSAAYKYDEAFTPTAGNYRVLLTALPGCTNVYSSDAVVSITPINSSLADSGTTDQYYQEAGTVYNYTDNDCKRLATVHSLFAELGQTVVSTSIDTSLEGYVARYIDIHPEHNVPAFVRLYFTQEEFDAYNVWAAANNKPLLPAAPGDPNVTHIVVEQYHGTPGSGTTGPGGQYDASNSDLIPNSAITVQWDAGNHYWVLSFPVNGFSGFFITSDDPVPLPLGLVDIRAVHKGTANAVLWQTSDEPAIRYFELERSADAVHFNRIATVQAKGYASDYSYEDMKPLSGKNFYRLKMYNAAGNFSYSKVVLTTRSENSLRKIEAYPNPASSMLYVKKIAVKGANAKLSLTDAVGKVLLELPMGKEELRIDMSEYTAGIYFIRYTDDEGDYILKVAKE